MNPPAERLPSLRAYVLAATSQDVRLCNGCQSCDDIFTPGMDMTFGELMQAAARDDPRALSNDTLWACEPLLRQPIPCQAGLDVAQVVRALQRLALREGYRPLRES